ncbi:MAG: hypothetical protein RJA70_2000 [Pseudomonadota bacterium]
MKILYGVVGEGLGHAMRSRVCIEHLISQGHELEIMAAGRAYPYLKKYFEQTNQIHGLHIVTEMNRVQKRKTLAANAKEVGKRLPENIAAYFDLIAQFTPKLVISDFESWTHNFARLHRLPIVSIDNMQIINRARHSGAILHGARRQFEMTKRIVKSKLPHCNHYMISTFFYPELRKERTSLHPPILRPEVLGLATTTGEHLLVYQTAEGNQALQHCLEQLGVPCRVYGMRRDISSEVSQGHLTFCPISEEAFLRDLASARAVVASAGFTLMGEAVYLKKPMLAVPLSGQFEQLLNARYLAASGYGMAAEQLSTASLSEFVGRTPEFSQNLEGYHQDGNAEFLASLDQVLDRAEAGLL